MRATGIVRRIDELGRVVIPKEIRRTLRIREGDPLEIFTDHDGEVVLKKYSPIGEISGIAKDYTDSLNRALGHVACILDRDSVVSASGSPRKELWEKPISPEMEAAMMARQTLVLGRQWQTTQPGQAHVTNGGKLIPVTREELETEYVSQIIHPIIADGEVIGCVVVLGKDGETMGDIDIKVVETTATMVGKQMEQ